MRALPHPHIPAFASEGGVLRAEGLRSYLLELREAYTAYAPVPSVTLYMKSSRSIPSASPRPPVKKSVAPNKLRLGLQVSTAGLHPLPKLLLRIHPPIRYHPVHQGPYPLHRL